MIAVIAWLGLIEVVFLRGGSEWMYVGDGGAAILEILRGARIL